MTVFHFDLFVIGAGSGGVRAARLAASYGAKVGIAEEDRVGGTCVNRGCVPKKLFVYAGHLGEAIEDARGYGWQAGKAVFDWKTLVANKDREIERLNGVYIRNMERAGVKLFKARAELRDAHTVKLQDGQIITADTILIATGDLPAVPDVPGKEHVITSNEAFHLPELPKSIAIIGAGYIGVEFAGIFNALGVAVKLLYRSEQILRGFDEDLRHALAEEMRKKGVDILCNTDVVSIGKAARGYELTCTSGEKLKVGLVMYATGRKPNTQKLGLDKAGVECGAKGEIKVDEYSRSSAANVFAIGDVTSRVPLTPVAIHEGAAFAASEFNGNPTPVDHTYIPTAVFSQPEIGTAGLTEEKARQKYGKLDIYKAAFKPLKHALSGRDETMLMKLVVDSQSGKVLGCHILGTDAAEMAQILAIPLRMGVTKADFDATMALHPSAAEEFVTMREKWRPAAAAE